MVIKLMLSGYRMLEWLYIECQSDYRVVVKCYSGYRMLEWL